MHIKSPFKEIRIRVIVRYTIRELLALTYFFGNGNSVKYWQTKTANAIDVRKFI